MPRGGQRPGAGAKKGSKQKPGVRTLEKLEMAKLFREKCSARFGELVDAQFDAAKGVTHMMARGRDGKWVQVTDPDQMLLCLNSGESFYKLTAQNPNVLALKDVFDRMMGQPVKALELTGADGGPLVVTWQD